MDSVGNGGKDSFHERIKWILCLRKGKKGVFKEE